MNYTAVRNKAYNAIRKNGTECTLVHVTGETYVPLTNTYEKTVEETSGVCVVSNYTQEETDGTVIKVNDMKIMAVLEGTPVAGDSLKVQGKEYRIITAVPFMPNGATVIYYTIQGR